jgi:hypothetical protein
MTKTVEFNAAVAAKLATLREGNMYDKDKVGSLIKSIAGRSKTLDIDIHAAAIGALHTAAIHGDTSIAERITNALGKAARAKTLAAWFAHYSNVRLTFDKKLGHFTGKLCVADERMDEVALMDKAALALTRPFWDVEEKVQAGAFDDASFAKAVQALIKRAAHENAKLSPEARDALADLRVLAVKLPEAKPAAADTVDPLTVN